MNTRLIYDVGMHNGDDTAYYLSLGYNVLSIDASPDLVKKGKERFREAIADNRLEIINVGIASEEGHLDFYLNKINSVWNSFDKEIGNRKDAGYDVIKVKTDSMDHITAEKGMPHYMKIDIEGHDILCLDALKKCAEKPTFISVEVNNIDLIIRLGELGYTKFKIIDQFKFLPLELPVFKEYEMYLKHYTFGHSMNFFVRVARKLFGKSVNKYYESKYRALFNYDHPYGSSGPFGDHLPGKWQNYDQAVAIYNHYKSIFEKSKRNGGFNYWIDIHATT